MQIKKAAMAGTLESSDAQVTVEPGNGTIELSIESSVIHQFGKQIKATVLETLDRLDVKDAKVTVVDKGALDCTLRHVLSAQYTVPTISLIIFHGEVY